MIVNKPIAEMSKFDFEDMMITLRSQYATLRTDERRHGLLGGGLPKFYIQIENILLLERSFQGGKA